MQGAWIVAVAAAAGAYAGYVLARRGGGQSQGGQGGQGGQPSRSSPSYRICPQVVVTCQDGSPAPTPCDCEGRGGVKSMGVMV